MAPALASQIESFLEQVKATNPHEPEFLQAVHEVAEIVIPFMEEHPQYKDYRVLERMVEPERVIQFRVPWLDDNGEIRVNRGFRVGFNSAIGPYKGGLRFHPTVNLSILKFLGFEQVFKNALTTLPIGGGKGGADFNPKGKSDNEVMKFCQSFMSELFRHIGPNTDVPAGDIGVGGREIGYMFGQYKRLQNEFTGVLTGKGVNWGGSLIRPEATGYGVVYFTQEMLESVRDTIKGKKVLISGSGNVAQYAAEKILHLGGKVITMSDSSGYVHVPDGIHTEKLDFIKELKNVRRGRIKELADHYEGVDFVEHKTPWEVAGEVALPCATQNELHESDAQALLNNGLICVTEGANMPCTPEAIELFQKHNALYAPGKASNAGGVATSALEMTQNSMRYNWTAEEVDGKLHQIMRDIHEACRKYGASPEGVDYVKGANIAGFVKVADSMMDQGVV